MFKQTTIDFIKERYVDRVESFIDDPEECACDGKDFSHAKDDVVNYYNYLVEIGEDIGFGFWDAVKEQAWDFALAKIRVRSFCEEYGINFPQWL